VGALEHVVELAHVEQPQLLGAVERAFEAAAIDDLREVQHCAGEARAGNRGDGLDIAREDPGSPMGDDAGAAASRLELFDEFELELLGEVALELLDEFELEFRLTRSSPPPQPPRRGRPRSTPSSASRACR